MQPKGSPCKGCPDRKPACHDKCERYQIWLAEYRKQEAAIKEWRLQMREEYKRSETFEWENRKRRF